MNKPLERKVRDSVTRLRHIWRSLDGFHSFIAFSTGKDSLALAAILYEAMPEEPAPCLYVHHKLEFPGNVEYASQLGARGFQIEVLRPNLEYFELMDRGMGFITLKEPWCIPLLVGTGLLGWVRDQGARSPREAVMFRGMSGSEYCHGLHAGVELYRRLNLPCINPMLSYSREEILEILRSRYGLLLNPIYEHMKRSYCICCYTSDAQRQSYSQRYFPGICRRYYGQIEQLLFGSGLIDKACLDERYKERHEKLNKHGFVHWKRLRAQTTIGAVKRQTRSGTFVYTVREASWIEPKHLEPLRGNWSRKGNEIRFWDIPEPHADTVIRRMLNCVDCGFCSVECFPCRTFDRKTRRLRIVGCTQCGRCLRLGSCMGWRHRFWRRDIGSESHGR